MHYDKIFNFNEVCNVVKYDEDVPILPLWIGIFLDDKTTFHIFNRFQY